MEAGLQVGATPPPEQVRSAGSIARYFGLFNPARQDRWVFGDRDSGAYLRKFAWTQIVRHRMVAGTASPDDPALTDYWASAPPQARHRVDDTTTLRLLRASTAAVHVCGGLVPAARRPATKPTRVGTVAHGHPQGDPQTRITAWADGTPDERRIPSHTRPLPPPTTNGSEPSTSARPRASRACLSRLPGKRARPVLRGPGRSNAPGLPVTPSGSCAC